MKTLHAIIIPMPESHIYAVIGLQRYGSYVWSVRPSDNVLIFKLGYEPNEWYILSEWDTNSYERQGRNRSGPNSPQWDAAVAAFHPFTPDMHVNGNPGDEDEEDEEGEE